MGRLSTAARPKAFGVALAFILAACGGGLAASPSATLSEAPTASPTAAATPTAEPTGTPIPTSTEGATATAGAGACQPQAATALSQGWKELTGKDGDYRFSRPAAWLDLSQTIPTNASVSPTTFAETGLGSAAKINADLVRAEDGSVGVSAWVLKGVRTATADLFARELAWLRTQPQVKTVLDDRLDFCIDGSTARGFSSTWSLIDGDKHIVIYILQRNGKMYEVQLTADDPAGVDTLEELLRTWTWSEPLAGTPPNIDAELAATKFAAIGTSSELDQSGQHPNTATFNNVFPTTADRIYAIYELDDGIHETVLFTWKRNGANYATTSFDYSDKTSFAWTWLNGPFKAGDYEMTATLKTSGDTITVAFKVQ